MDYAFASIANLGLFDPERTDAVSCYGTRSELRKHWFCAVGGKKYTVHIRPDEPAMSFVTDGWDAGVDVTDSPYLARMVTNHKHAAGSYKVVKRTLEQLFPAGTGWQCWAGARMAAHWKCRIDFDNGTSEYVTVHISPKGDSVNPVTDGWDPTTNIAAG